MGGALMELVAKGSQDVFLTGNPSVSYFRNVYKRHTNFAFESIQQSINGESNFGKKIECIISRSGDLLSGIILEIDDNKVESIMDVSKFITMSTDEIIDFKVKRSYEELILKIKPNIVLGEDNLGNKLNKRIVGIKLGAYNDEINHVKLGPVKAIYHAAHEVYYVAYLL